MRISDNEIKKKLQSGHYAVVSDITDLGNSIKTREKEADHIKQVTAEVIAMPDREYLIADLKARIEAGSYNPTGDDIADAMIRRSIADRII
jgi:anti-sigma28 factor (negative regulator of flagellin synthesis)